MWLAKLGVQFWPLFGWYWLHLVNAEWTANPLRLSRWRQLTVKRLLSIESDYGPTHDHLQMLPNKFWILKIPQSETCRLLFSDASNFNLHVLMADSNVKLHFALTFQEASDRGKSFRLSLYSRGKEHSYSYAMYYILRNITQTWLGFTINISICRPGGIDLRCWLTKSLVSDALTFSFYDAQPAWLLREVSMLPLSSLARDGMPNSVDPGTVQTVRSLVLISKQLYLK